MTTEATPPAAATPAPAQPVTPPAAVTTPAASSPVPQPTDENQPWFKERLARERETLLKELGVDDTSKAKAAIEAAKKAEEDSKTAAQKLGETSETLKTEKARAERYELVVKDHAAREIGKLTVEQQAAVRKLAPDTDPAGQLNAIDVLAPTWGKPAPAAATTETPKPAPPPTPPGGTAPPRDAPAPTNPTSPPDHKAVYAELEKTNPFRASRYALEHAQDIYKS